MTRIFLALGAIMLVNGWRADVITLQLVIVKP